MPSTGDNQPESDVQTFTIVFRRKGEPVVTVQEFPADWPQHLCEAQMATRFWEGVNLRMYRYVPQVRTTIWAARRATARAFKDMLAAYEQAK